MRRPRYVNMRCPACGERYERFVETNDDGTPLEPERCNHALSYKLEKDLVAGTADEEIVYCGEFLVLDDEGSSPFGNSPLMAPLAGKNVKTNLQDAERQRERLQRRQDEHWKKQGRDEAISRERSVLGSGGKAGGW